jgi:esterase FrsA
MTLLLPKTLDLTSEIQLEYLGPSIDLGPLPAVLYFALSAKDSLALDPYNQPAAYLSPFPLRVFSISLPYHKEGLIATKALAKWAEVMHKKEPLLEDYFEKVQRAIHILLHREILIPSKIAAMGLSRGAFIAAHVAAKNPEIPYWLGFAPLTKLSYLPEFSNLTDWDLIHVITPLSEKTIRCYIGNRDTRVGTRNCFDLITLLAESAYQKRHLSPPIELLISPSIGHHGHGTKKDIFHHGARWLAKQLQVAL